MSNCRKLTEGSYKIFIKKIEQVLTAILMEIDPDSTKRITFEQLGRVLTLLELFIVCKYDENFNRIVFLEITYPIVVNVDQFIHNTNKDQKRRFSEV